MRHGLFFCRFRAGGDLGSFGARRGHGARRAGPRLRSGAFAPDCPCLILVIAYGDSFGFRWAYRRPAHRAPQPHRARGVGNETGVGAGGLLGVFFAVLVVWRILRGPRCVGRAGGLAALTRWCAVSGARCAPASDRWRKADGNWQKAARCQLAPGSEFPISVIFRIPSISWLFGRWFHACGFIRVSYGTPQRPTGHVLGRETPTPDSISLKTNWSTHT